MIFLNRLSEIKNYTQSYLNFYWQLWIVFYVQIHKTQNVYLATRGSQSIAFCSLLAVFFLPYVTVRVVVTVLYWVSWIIFVIDFFFAKPFLRSVFMFSASSQLGFLDLSWLGLLGSWCTFGWLALCSPCFLALDWLFTGSLLAITYLLVAALGFISLMLSPLVGSYSQWLLWDWFRGCSRLLLVALVWSFV